MRGLHGPTVLIPPNRADKLRYGSLLLDRFNNSFGPTFTTPRYKSHLFSEDPRFSTEAKLSYARCPIAKIIHSEPFYDYYSLVRWFDRHWSCRHRQFFSQKRVGQVSCTFSPDWEAWKGMKKSKIHRNMQEFRSPVGLRGHKHKPRWENGPNGTRDDISDETSLPWQFMNQYLPTDCWSKSIKTTNWKRMFPSFNSILPKWHLCEKLSEINATPALHNLVVIHNYTRLTLLR